MRRSIRLRQVRALLVATFIATSAFAVEATPPTISLPRPEAFTPAPAKALGCADEPAFEGRITGSATSTTAITRSTTGNVYGYISKVVDDWSCTSAFRYDGLVWTRTDGNGYWDWGNLINSTSVACNWVIGSTDYLKANTTTDCPDSDAEYAMPIYLGANSGGGLLETTFHQDVNHDTTGDFMFIHTDCTTYYGGESIKYGQEWPTSNIPNRPGDNCDPRVIDGTNTSQSIIVDGTAPTTAFTAPSGTMGTILGTSSMAYTVTVNATDNLAKFGSTHPWTLQRQIARNTGAGQCDPFVNDAATGGYVSGTTSANGQTSAQTLVSGYCYRWILSASDMNGNTTAAKTSATVVVDTSAPRVMFLAPQPVPGGSPAVTRNATTYQVSWQETEGESGVSTRSLQRQKVASMSPACPGGFANDGSAVTTASPSSQALTGGNCYQWIETVTDKANNSTSCTSGPIYIDTTYPAASFSVPADGTIGYQGATSVSVTWTETAGSGSVTARSLQRQKASGTVGTCTGLTWANDGTAVTTGSPVSASSLTEGPYRWLQTLTNSAGKTGLSTSGWAVIDTNPPTAQIATPVANQPLTGMVTITGQATDSASFKDFILDYGAGASPSTWTPIGTFTTAVPSGGTLGSWPTAGLSGVYTIRLTVRENASSTTSVVTRTVVLENAGRGSESSITRIPYDLGGGWALDVGVANGEARLSRDLFSIPSYGPAQALSLSYSSAESGTAGKFGVGWSSNLTQYLTFDATGITTWHRADGGRVPFGNLSGTWTPLIGDYETMTVGTDVTITTKDQTRYVFESSGAGRLKRIENRFGKALTLVWNTTSATATDASGRVTTLVIDSTNNRITGATDSAGRAWAFGYTGTTTSSDLTTVTDPATKVTTLGYTSHALTSVQRSRSPGPVTITWTIGYTAGKATSVKDPILANANVFTYTTGLTTSQQVLDDTGPVIAETDYTLDSDGRFVVGTTDADGNGTTRQLDPAGNVTADNIPTEDDGVAQTISTFDARGNLLSERRYVDANTYTDTLYTYNATNDLLTRTDSDNDDTTRTVTLYVYDSAGHRTSEIRGCTSTGTFIAQGAGGACTGAGTQNADTNVIANYAYTANDQLEYEQDPMGVVTKHIYDANGNETSVIADCTTSGITLPALTGCTAAGTHDGATNVTTTTAYLATDTDGKAGLPTSSTDALGRTTSYDYDALGRQTSEVLPGDATSIPALTRTTAYDELGNPLTETETWTPLTGGSAINRVTSHAYDKVNRETSVTDPSTTATTTTDYDGAGNAITTTTLGSGATLTTTSRKYDLRNQLVSEVLLTSGEISPKRTIDAYTTLGAEARRTEIDGRIVLSTNRFDGAVTQTVSQDPGATVVSTTTSWFDKLGNETSSTDAQGTTTDSTHDRLGRLTSTTTAGAVTSYTYDRDGNQLTVTDPVGIVTTTTYDRLNRATVVVANDVASPTLLTEDVTTTTYYDAAGNTIAIKDPRGITTRTIINARDQAFETIADCTDTGTTTPSTNPPACTGGTATDTANVKTDLTYDGQGNVIKTITAVGRPAAATTETAYDAAGHVQATKDPMGTITRNQYDPGGRLTDTYVNCTTTGTTIPTDWVNCTGTGTTNRTDGTYNLHTSYTYDELGNQAQVTGPNGRKTASRYNESNVLYQSIDNYVDGIAGATDDLTTTYVYDDLGRQTATIVPTSDGLTTIVNRTIYNDDGTVASEIRNCVDIPAGAPEDCTGTDTVNLVPGVRDEKTNLITTYAYDSRGNRVKVDAPDPSATTGSAVSMIKTQSAFDADGRLCRVVDNATGSTDLQALTHPCTDTTQTAGTATTNLSTRYTYDGMGNLASMIDASGHPTTYGYDAAGNSTGRTDALGASLILGYDDAGRLAVQRNRTDVVGSTSVGWTYDAQGRMLSRAADGVTTSYTYDANGNKKTATTGSMVITATYDRLNRVLTVDDEDAGTTPDTTYTYSFTSPAWTDPTGSYTATLDKLDRVTAVNDPVFTPTFTWAYRADNQPSSYVQPDGNTTAFGYDAVGHLTSKNTTAAGPVNRATYAWTYNRAGQVLTENENVTGSPTTGTVTYGYDPLAQLASSAYGGTTTTYGWDTATNRTSVQVGAGTPATTAYDNANRPTSGANPSVTYGADADGRLTARSGQTLVYDRLGRLTAVKNAAGTVTLAAYSYDPLDRLRIADYTGNSGGRVRFRYVGLTTSAAQWIDDVAGTVTRNIANGWAGDRLFDWATGLSDARVYGENAHHDVTWLATNAGPVTQSLRYDPFGNPRATPPTGYTPFRFQGSWYDSATDLSWVVTRWYSQGQGRFATEDTLLGEPADPASRQLYAYAEGNPVAGWDPEGQSWYVLRGSDTWFGLGRRFYGGSGSLYTRIISGNPGGRITPVNLGATSFANAIGKCIWIPFTRFRPECNKARGDNWAASGSDLWHTFDNIVTFMADRMVKDRDYLNNKYTDFISRSTMLKVDFGTLVCGNCKWDYKVKLNALYGNGKKFWTSVRDDRAPEVLRSDVWGNIYYGYVGRAVSISEQELWVGQKALGGTNDAVDDAAVRLGFQLWNSVRMNVGRDSLRYLVLDSMRTFRKAGAGGVKVPLVDVLKS